jgi:hypothetical protein
MRLDCCERKIVAGQRLGRCFGLNLLFSSIFHVRSAETTGPINSENKIETREMRQRSERRERDAGSGSTCNKTVRNTNMNAGTIATVTKTNPSKASMQIHNQIHHPKVPERMRDYGMLNRKWIQTFRHLGTKNTITLSKNILV